MKHYSEQRYSVPPNPACLPNSSKLLSGQDHSTPMGNNRLIPKYVKPSHSRCDARAKSTNGSNSKANPGGVFASTLNPRSDELCGSFQTANSCSKLVSASSVF